MILLSTEMILTTSLFAVLLGALSGLIYCILTTVFKFTYNNLICKRRGVLRRFCGARSIFGNFIDFIFFLSVGICFIAFNYISFDGAFVPFSILVFSLAFLMVNRIVNFILLILQNKTDKM